MPETPRVPVWLLGRHLSLCTLEIGLASPAGDIGFGTPGVLTGLIDQVTVTPQFTTENIVPVTSFRENAVAVEQADTMELVEIMRARKSVAPAADFDPNFLGKAWSFAQLATTPSEYARVIINFGGMSWSAIGLMADYNEQPRKGKTVARLLLEEIDPIDSDGGTFIPIANFRYFATPP